MCLLRAYSNKRLLDAGMHACAGAINRVSSDVMGVLTKPYEHYQPWKQYKNPKALQAAYNQRVGGRGEYRKDDRLDGVHG